MRLPSRISSRLRETIRHEQRASPVIRRLRRRVKTSERRIVLLETRVKELEAEIQDARVQGRRAAEIADLVTELLSNEASRRDPEFVRILERYTRAG